MSSLALSVLRTPYLSMRILSAHKPLGVFQLGAYPEYRTITSCSCPTVKTLSVPSTYSIRQMSFKTDVEQERLKPTKLGQKIVDFRLKLGLLPRDKSYYLRRAVVLYEAIDDVDKDAFFKAFSMENTFFSWFRIAELHLWMIMVKSNALGEEGKLLNKLIIDYMWEDVRRRGKALSTDNISSAVNKGLQTFHKEMIAAMIGYDQGLLSSDVVLANALWNRFLLKKCDNPELVEKLVKYVRIQVQHLDRISKDDFLGRAKLTWLPLVSKVP